MTVQPDAALESLGAIGVADAIATTSTRITELHTIYLPQEEHHNLALVGEGV